MCQITPWVFVLNRGPKHNRWSHVNEGKNQGSFKLHFGGSFISSIPLWSDDYIITIGIREVLSAATSNALYIFMQASQVPGAEVIGDDAENLQQNTFDWDHVLG